MNRTVCRLCVGTTELEDIFHEKFKVTNMVNVISTTTGVQILPQDKIPKLVCRTCIKITNQMFKYRYTCLKNDSDFRADYNVSQLFNSDLEDKTLLAPLLEEIDLTEEDSETREPSIQTDKVPDTEISTVGSQQLETPPVPIKDSEVAVPPEIPAASSVTCLKVVQPVAAINSPPALPDKSSKETRILDKYRTAHPSIREIIKKNPKLLLPALDLKSHFGPCITIAADEVTEYFRQRQGKRVYREASKDEIKNSKISTAKKSKRQSPVKNLEHHAENMAKKEDGSRKPNLEPKENGGRKTNVEAKDNGGKKRNVEPKEDGGEKPNEEPKEVEARNASPSEKENITLNSILWDQTCKEIIKPSGVSILCQMLINGKTENSSSKEDAVLKEKRKQYGVEVTAAENILVPAIPSAENVSKPGGPDEDSLSSFSSLSSHEVDKSNAQVDFARSLHLQPKDADISLLPDLSLVSVSSNYKVYTCSICNLPYTCRKSLQRHQRQAHTKCQFCWQRFANIQLKNEHLISQCLFHPNTMKSMQLSLVKVDEDPEMVKYLKKIQDKEDGVSAAQAQTLCHELGPSSTKENPEVKRNEITTLPMETEPANDTRQAMELSSGIELDAGIDKHMECTGAVSKANGASVICISDDEAEHYRSQANLTIPTHENVNLVKSVNSSNRSEFDTVLLVRKLRENSKCDWTKQTTIANGSTGKTRVFKNLRKYVQTQRIPVNIKYNSNLSVSYKLSPSNPLQKTNDTWNHMIPITSLTVKPSLPAPVPTSIQEPSVSYINAGISSTATSSTQGALVNAQSLLLSSGIGTNTQYFYLPANYLTQNKVSYLPINTVSKPQRSSAVTTSVLNSSVGLMGSGGGIINRTAPVGVRTFVKPPGKLPVYSSSIVSVTTAPGKAPSTTTSRNTSANSLPQVTSSAGIRVKNLKELS